MRRGDLSLASNWLMGWLVLGALFVCVPASLHAQAAPATPAAPASPPGSAEPANAQAPATPPAPSAPAAPSASPPPEVTTITPTRLGQGFDVDLKITGKNFVQGTKVSFSNPGVRMLRITSFSSTELTVHIKVASDATTGATSLFVVNPDDNEVEVPFEVIAKGVLKPSPSTPPSPGSPPASPSPGSPPSPDTTSTQRFEAFHLGNPAEIFHVHGKVKGSLVVSSGTIQYQEDGKTLINIALSDIKEIKTSSAFPDTFHITLNSGKSFHFAPGSLRPSDARKTVDSLRQSLPH